MKTLVLFHYTNKPNLAKSSLQSLLAQERREWELAVINDGGTLQLPQLITSKTYTVDKKNSLSSCLDQAVQDSDADLAIYLKDSDYLYENYLENLYLWFTEKCKKASYAFSGITLYDPLTEKPRSPFIYPYAYHSGNQLHKVDNLFNQAGPEVSPFQLDLSQIAWRLPILKKYGKRVFGSKPVDILDKFYSSFGKCVKTDFFAQYKACYFSEEIDLPSAQPLKIAVLARVSSSTGWEDIKYYIFNLKRFSNLEVAYFFEATDKIALEAIAKDLPMAAVRTSCVVRNWHESEIASDYILYVDDRTPENLLPPNYIQPAISLLQDKKTGVVSSKIWMASEINLKNASANAQSFNFSKPLKAAVSDRIFWCRPELLVRLLQKPEKLNTSALGLLVSQLASELDLSVLKIPIPTDAVPVDWDEAGYLVKYPDVIAAVKKRIFKSGWEHYQKHGKAEGRTFTSLSGNLTKRNRRISATGPSDWDEDRYLQDFPQIAEAIKFGLFESGWDHFRKSKTGLLPSNQKYFKNQIAEGLTNYVLATWSGYRRGEKNCESVQYLSTNIRALTKYKHNLSQITIAVPENPDEPEEFTKYLESLPTQIGTAKVVVFRRKNFGQSYGSYCDVYKTYNDKFKYYLFVEDDYVAVEDDFDTTLIRQFELAENCGYLASWVYDWEGQPHAAVSNGLTSREVLRALTEQLGCVPHGDKVVGVDYSVSSQLQFSWGFLEIGMNLCSFSDYQIPYNHAGELRIFNKQAKKNILVPIQFLKELGFGDLLSE